MNNLMLFFFGTLTRYIFSLFAIGVILIFTLPEVIDALPVPVVIVLIVAIFIALEMQTPKTHTGEKEAKQ
jgi:hypothetical protein